MKQSVLVRSAISCGGGALDYLERLMIRKAVVVADRRTEFAQNAVEKIEDILKEKGIEYIIKDDMGRKPGIADLIDEVALFKSINADTIIAVGDDTTINIAKLLLLLYEYPGMSFSEIETENDKGAIRLQTRFVVIASNSSMAEEVNRLGTIMIDDTDFVER